MKRKSVYTCLVMLFMSLVLQAKDKDVAVAEALLKTFASIIHREFSVSKVKRRERLLYNRVCKR